MEKEVEKEMKTFLESIIPSENERGEISFSYSFQDDTLLIYESSLQEGKSGNEHRMAVVRINYIKSRDIWKIYIRHNRFDWDVYKPKPEVKKLSHALKLLKDDKYSLFLDKLK